MYTLNLFLSCTKEFLIFVEGQCLSILLASIDFLFVCLFLVWFLFWVVLLNVKKF